MFDHDPRDRENDDPRDVEAHWITLGRGSAKDARDPFDDIRERDHDTRHRDPREPFVHGLELPRGPEREIVVDGRHRYELNGTSISSSGRSASSDQRGKTRSHRRKADGCATSRSRHDSRRRFAIIVICVVGSCCTRTMDRL
jgi:hypothetical protein